MIESTANLHCVLVGTQRRYPKKFEHGSLVCLIGSRYDKFSRMTENSIAREEAHQEGRRRQWQTLLVLPKSKYLQTFRFVPRLWLEFVLSLKDSRRNISEEIAKKTLGSPPTEPIRRLLFCLQVFGYDTSAKCSVQKNELGKLPILKLWLQLHCSDDWLRSPAYSNFSAQIFHQRPPSPDISRRR